MIIDPNANAEFISEALEFTVAATLTDIYLKFLLHSLVNEELDYQKGEGSE
ncbi:hypothetical protein [Peribacillus simplex]|uniref:hypothetical protein n=1 Tax=Peribacillus simplex TaxID=1478 RepID=UPI0016272CA4|nr:hypothetical protein [Peribacillus simplex]